jgi:hypothetical protein
MVLSEMVLLSFRLVRCPGVGGVTVSESSLGVRYLIVVVVVVSLLSLRGVVMLVVVVADNH